MTQPMAPQKLPEQVPPQHQTQGQPGHQQAMQPQPIEETNYRGSGKLDGKAAIVTGADSGIGRAAALYFAKEGADVAVIYLSEDQDAQKTKQLVEAEGRRCILIKGDVGDEQFCQRAVEQANRELGHLDVLVNNAGEQHIQKDFEQISAQQLEQTFRTNIFGYFYMAKAALPHLKEGAAIVNTASVTAYHGAPELIDYASTKGAIIAFTRSLARNLAPKGIRVNAVAPGPIWTPLIPATFTAEHVAKFGKNTPLGRPGQPAEMAPSYVFLASDDSSYMTGQVLHPNGGEEMVS